MGVYRRRVQQQVIRQGQGRQSARHVEPVQVVIPPAGRDGHERQDGNGPQQQDKRPDHPVRRMLVDARRVWPVDLGPRRRAGQTNPVPRCGN